LAWPTSSALPASTGDWREVVTDPAVDIVSIATPNALHKEMALAALEAGKHVWCEKPMALTLADAEEMAAAARAAGTVTLVGYNYLRNPAYRHAQNLIAEGRIGRPVHFRGWVDEDYQADPDLPWTWRARRAEAGLGALGDLGCHLVSLAVGLMGPIDSLIADIQIIHRDRPLPEGGRAAVENEDTATAILRFASGAQGSLSTSRSAWGRKNRLDFEVHGTAGQIVHQQERMNELQLYEATGPVSEQGFRTILSGPAHPPFDRFVPKRSSRAKSRRGPRPTISQRRARTTGSGTRCKSCARPMQRFSRGISGTRGWRRSARHGLAPATR
jgi:predicted dehydrogenase